MKQAIDIYHGSLPIDWHAFSDWNKSQGNPVVLCQVKIFQGEDDDPMAWTNIHNAIVIGGLKVQLYVFVDATTSQWDQDQKLQDWMSGTRGDAWILNQVMLDIEQQKVGENFVQQDPNTVRTLIQTARLYFGEPLIYGPCDDLDASLPQGYDQIPYLDIANYNAGEPALPRRATRWAMHQYTESATVPGFAPGSLDMSWIADWYAQEMGL